MCPQGIPLPFPLSEMSPRSLYLLSGAASAWLMMRVPGMRAGLNERSQSAHAARAPNPVDRAMGHVRPGIKRAVVQRS